MTTLIQQRSGNDCVLAAIAMAVGKERWEDLWTEEDLQKVIQDKGIADIEPWLDRAGVTAYRQVYIHGVDMRTCRALLWKRRALLSVDSLNNNGGSHMVYWDGDKLWDPHTGHEEQGLLAFKWLSTVHISRAFLLV